MNTQTEQPSNACAANASADVLTLYGETFASRVLLGTARYPSLQALTDSVETARPAMLTVALRRQMGGDGEIQAGFFDALKARGVPLLPNTAGCHSVREEIGRASCRERV